MVFPGGFGSGVPTGYPQAGGFPQQAGGIPFQYNAAQYVYMPSPTGFQAQQQFAPTGFGGQQPIFLTPQTQGGPFGFGGANGGANQSATITTITYFSGPLGQQGQAIPGFQQGIPGLQTGLPGFMQGF